MECGAYIGEEAPKYQKKGELIMKFNRNEKVMLFVFGSTNGVKTINNLMSAGMMAGETSLRTLLWGLAERIWKEEPDTNDYAADYCEIRRELEPMFYAPVITYDEEKGHYVKSYPLLDVLVEYLFSRFMGDYGQDKLDFVVRHVANVQVKARLDELLNDWHDTCDGDTPMLNQMYEGHEQIGRGIAWLFREEDADEADEV